MRTLLHRMAAWTFAFLLGTSGALAQERAPFGQAELDQMLAPVALYPDALLSQILMASTYPLEVVQAARWSRARPGLKGREAVDAAAPMDWDPSVKSLTAFPQILAMMDERLDWTERLGEAFIGQQAEVMEAVQGLRRRAEAAGNLQSDERMAVLHRDGAIAIEPPASGIVYVPYYAPTVVFGAWWWPAYPPVVFAPPPAVYLVSAYRPAFVWGDGILFSAGFFFGHFDWPRRRVEVVHAHRYPVHGHPAQPRTVWRHEPIHRRGVPYRHVNAIRHPGERPAFEPRHRAAMLPAPDGHRAGAAIPPRSVSPPQPRERARVDARASRPHPATPGTEPPRQRQAAAAPRPMPAHRRDASPTVAGGAVRADARLSGTQATARAGPDRGARRIDQSAERRPQAAPAPRPNAQRNVRAAEPRPLAATARSREAPRPAASRGAPPRREAGARGGGPSARRAMNPS